MKAYFLKSSFAVRVPWLLLGLGGSCFGQYQQATLLDMEARRARADRADFYILGQYWHTERGTADNITVPTTLGPPATGNISFELHDSGAFGLGVAYHLNNHLAVAGELTFGYPDYTLTFLNATLSGEAFMHAGTFKLEYNILPGPITPFISGGLGYLYIDSQVPSGPPTPYCFWDYWWGYTCTSATPTHRNTYFTVDAAVGIRWDIGENLDVKLSAGGNWALVHNAANWLQTIQITTAVGWKF